MLQISNVNLSGTLTDYPIRFVDAFCPSGLSRPHGAMLRRSLVQILHVAVSGFHRFWMCMFIRLKGRR